MSEVPVYRYRIQFAKTTSLRFIGHLDLHRTWERTLRRAGAPLAYTRGYNPHPRLNIGMALPLGCTSRGDLMDLFLEQEWETDQLLDSLRRAAPPGLEIERVERVPEGEPAIQHRLLAADYQVQLAGEDHPADLQARIGELLAAEALMKERRGKRYDLRPLIERLELQPPVGDRPAQLSMRLTAMEGATGRPQEVLEALGLDPLVYIPHRLRLILAHGETDD